VEKLCHVQNRLGAGFPFFLLSFVAPLQLRSHSFLMYLIYLIYN
jgi:hypothetical protein